MKTTYDNFPDWCKHKENISEDAKHTVEILLQISDTSECDRAALYIYLFGSSLTAENAAALSNPKLADIAKFLGEETAAATGWIHFLVMDLFVGRWIYWEGQRTGVWTVHSLALCFFAGPMGLLSHIVTAWITQRFFPSSESPSGAGSPVHPQEN